MQQVGLHRGMKQKIPDGMEDTCRVGGVWPWGLKVGGVGKP